MELTTEYLINNGYTTDHPERVFAKYKKTTPSSRIVVEQTYKPLSNEIAYLIDCLKTDEKGATIKRAELQYAKTIEELNTCMQLANIA